MAVSKCWRPLQLVLSLYLSVTILWGKEPISGIFLPTVRSLFVQPSTVLSAPSTASINTVTLSHPVNESALVDWPPSTLVQSHSSSFSTRRIPSKIAPFYYKAAYDSSLLPQDITITTLVTQNRFNVLANLAERYQGPPALHLRFV